ncbi:MAG TPA: MFS transporter [Terrimicrobiaceae bacterium]
MIPNNLRYAYFTQFVSSFCQAAFFPILSIWLFKEHFFSSGEVALIISARVLSYRLAGLLFADVVRRCHKKTIILCCFSAVALLYAGLFLAALDRIAFLPLWLAFAVLIGGMLSVASLAVTAYTVRYPSNDSANLQMPFAVLNIALNLGMCVGPICGTLALTCSQHFFLLLPLVSAIIGALASSQLALDKPVQGSAPRGQGIDVLNLKFSLLVIIYILTGVAYAQFYEVLPAYAMGVMNQQTIGILFSVSGFVIILLQLPITRLSSKFSSSSLIVVSNLILAAGTILFVPARAGSIMSCVFGTILISVAEIIYTPLYQALAVQVLRAEAQVLGLAILTSTWGIVEAAASFVGIFATGHGYGHLSFILGATAAIAVVLLGVLRIGAGKLAHLQWPTRRGGLDPIRGN